jgi:hypothetical protein
MNAKILFKLTLKVPGTKLLADFLFGSQEDLDSFLELNEIKPFEVKRVIDKRRK